MIRKLAMCLCLFIFFVASACSSTSTVRFETKTKAMLSVVEWDQLDSQGKELGETPKEIEVSEIKEKVLKIAAPGKTPQFWVFSDTGGQKFEAKLTLTDVEGGSPGNAGAGGGGVSGTADINETHRLLMKSYQSLASGDLTASIALAKKLNEIEPRLAAPLIIIGLANIQQGDKEEARLSFNKAKTLDPKDGDIDRLLEATQ